jgi:Ca2+-transporting ATPase
MQFGDYAIKNSKEIFQDLCTSENGISEKEAKERQKRYGLNEIFFKKTAAFDILLRQFNSSFVYLLLIAAFVSFVIGEEIDSLLILLFVLINVSLGFFQEFRAERAAQILKSYLPSKVRVKREGKEKIIDKKFLVPGDIVFL